MCPVVFQGHTSNCKVTRLTKLSILTKIGRFQAVTPVWIHWWIWNDALLFSGVIHQISMSHGLKNWRFESNLSKITRRVTAIKSLRFALLPWEARIREIKTKGLFFRHECVKIWKRVKFCMYLFPFVSSACLNCYTLMYLGFNHTLEVMKNTMYMEKCLQFDTVILTFIKFLSYSKKRVLLWKRGVYLGLKISDCGWKRGVYYSSKIREKGVFFRTLVRAWYTLWSALSGWPGICMPIGGVVIRYVVISKYNQNVVLVPKSSVFY